MFSLVIIATVMLATAWFVFPHWVPAIDKLVSILKYPAYGYIFLLHLRPALLHLYADILGPHIARIFASHQHTEARLATSGGPGFARRLAMALLRGTGSLFTPVRLGWRDLADHFAGIFRGWSFPSLNIHHALGSLPFVAPLNGFCERVAKVWWYLIYHFHQLLVDLVLQFVSTSLPFGLSYTFARLALSIGIVTPAYDLSFAAKYPLSFVTGVVTSVILRRGICNTLSFGGLAISLVGCGCIVATVRLAYSPRSLKIVVWATLGLLHCCVYNVYDVSFRELHIFAKHAILAFLIGSDIVTRQLARPRPALRSIISKRALQVPRYFGHLCIATLKFLARVSASTLYFVLRRVACLVLGKIVAPVVRVVVLKVICWACVVCVEGCTITCKVGLELVAALLAPLHGLDLLAKFKASGNETERILEAPSASRSRTTSISSSEGSLSTPFMPSTPSTLAPSKSVRRLGLLLNAYLSESASTESILELEAEFKNTPSMHAPPTLSAPSTPLSSATSSPVPVTPPMVPAPFPPLSPTSTPAHAQVLTNSKKDDDISSLISRLSNFRLALESSPASQEIKQAARRSPITFKSFAPPIRPGPVTPPRKEWTYLEWERGAIASFCLSLVAPANEGLRERNLERLNAGHMVAMNMRK